ncbi:hypothetical protein AYO46_05595 [Betaproteobacteria bacterium SCGC AG-212-J23]|nr:hypothetical protein AYO46_05595 [Betaproteobacteria bacterium SCGC AG-212-J23]
MKTLRLKPASTLRIEDGAGMVVEVSQGEVWLTQERDPRDYYLRAGEWLRIDRKGSVVVSAVGDDAWIGLTALRPELSERVLALLGLGSALQPSEEGR